MGVQEVRCGVTMGHSKSRVCNFFYGKRHENHQMGTGFFVHHRIILAVNTVELVNDTMSYVVLKGRWCNIIVPNVNAPSEEKSDDL